MSRKTTSLALALLCGVSRAGAEPANGPAVPPGGAQAELRAHFGVATTPFDVASLPQAKGQAFVLAAAGAYVFSERLSLRLNVPLVLGSVGQPAGSYVDAAAWGNPELGARWAFMEQRSGPSTLEVAGALDVGAPLASHADSLMPNRLLAIADGLVGRGRPERFTPGIAPITASGELRWASSRWTLHTELRLPLLVRVSEADLPSGSSNTRSAGVAALVGAEGRYRLSRRLSLAATARLFFDLEPVTAHVRDVSLVQDFERLSLHVHLGLLGALVVDLQTAAGGALGGTMVAGGLRGVVGFP